MQWRKESLLALTGSRSRITAPGKDNLWLVTELRLTGWERQLVRHQRPLRELGECRFVAVLRPWRPNYETFRLDGLERPERDVQDYGLKVRNVLNWEEGTYSK